MNKGYFSKKIIDWYSNAHRNLPWRNTRDPYKIWLSEIILQQTRVAQGLPYYQKFIQKFPTVQKLARAPEQEILRLWQGLGYYTRARNLHACARTILDLHQGNFPTSSAALRKLPGIGEYTAAAIASFAFDEPVAVVDGNVFRVLARYAGIDDDIATTSGKKRFATLAQELLPVQAAAIHNQAIMEFGALQCTPQQPKCDDCVLRKGCFAAHHDQQDQLPVKGTRTKVRHRYFHYLVIRRAGKILLSRRASGDIWTGLYDFPLVEGSRAATTPRAIKKILNLPSSKLPIIISTEYKHVLSHQIIHARFLEVLPTGKEMQAIKFSSLHHRWYTLKQVEKLPKPQLIVRYLAETGVL